MQLLQEIQFKEKKINIYGTAQNPFFLAKDLAELIEHTNARMMLKSIDEEEKVCVKNVYALQGQQEQWFISEYGMYEILMQSRKALAKEFKKQVKEILKHIRLTGGAVMNEEQFINNYFTSFSEDTKKAMFTELQENNKRIKEELSQANTILHSISNADNTFLVREVAKLISDEGITIGQNQLWDKLREWKLICANSKYEPTQMAIKRGLFKVIEDSRELANGRVLNYCTTRVTGKGQLYIHKKLLKEQGA